MKSFKSLVTGRLGILDEDADAADEGTSIKIRLKIN
jgi:hypothetical protein